MTNSTRDPCAPASSSRVISVRMPLKSVATALLGPRFLTGACQYTIARELSVLNRFADSLAGRQWRRTVPPGDSWCPTLAPLGTPQVDALEHQRELRSLHLDI